MKWLKTRRWSGSVEFSGGKLPVPHEGGPIRRDSGDYALSSVRETQKDTNASTHRFAMAENLNIPQQVSWLELSRSLRLYLGTASQVPHLKGMTGETSSPSERHMAYPHQRWGGLSVIQVPRPISRFTFGASSAARAAYSLGGQASLATEGGMLRAPRSRRRM